ncbi:MAG: hypothetical protein OR994_08700 [Candidatus Poseidoniales archaeon]|nr:hypothetical protein [Candidatus Poseidoniales archaeon]
MAILPMYQDVWHRVVSFTTLCAGATQKLAIHNLVPEEIQEQYRIIGKRVLLADFAGRDSIAACMQILKDEEIDTVIPVGDIVPSRYGDTDSYYRNWESLAQLIEKNHLNVELKPWFIIDGQKFWNTLNERYVENIMKKYGWFTPCIGCHFHFYAMRSVLVEILGFENTILASGEKRLHKNGKRKANQTDGAVKAYSKFSRDQGVDHRFPIHDFESENKIASLVGEMWGEGGSQMSCIHSGNDRENGTLKYSDEQISEMMTDYILPMGKRYVEMKINELNKNRFWNAMDDYSEELLE